MTDLRSLGMAIRAGVLSPTEHVTDALDRLAADPYNAVVTLDREGALVAAAALTEELAQGRWRGPLHGVALGVKDLIDVAGLPTRCGSNVLADAPPAAADAPAVARLRAAGAVVVAKLHTQEFAHGPTGDVSATGPAHNPHDPTRITGGSSSGSAAAVAAGYVPLALGTDTGCSVRTPAAHCGVVGLKPVFGHVSTAGVFPLAESLDHVGLLTADTHSAAVAWDVLDRAEGTGGGIPTPGVAGVRVGVPVDDYWRPVDPVIAEGVAAAVAALEKAGAQVVEVRTPMIEELAATYAPIVGAEAYATHAPWLAERPDDYQPVVRDRLLGFAGQLARGVRRRPTRPPPPGPGVPGGHRGRRRARARDDAAAGHPHRAGRGRRRAGPPGAAGAEPAVQPVGLARGVGSGAGGSAGRAAGRCAGRRGAAGGARNPAGGRGVRAAPSGPAA